MSYAIATLFEWDFDAVGGWLSARVVSRAR